MEALWSVLTILVEVGGSLGLFLYGMKVMSDGLQKGAGDGLQTVLNFMTRNRFFAVISGLIITTAVQSSSASTVMVVGFVNAGLLNLSQAIGMIMGANIGTTTTGWIVALLGFKFSIAELALPAVGVGFVLLMLKRGRLGSWGEALLGFGLLFLGLSFLRESIPDIRQYPEALAFVQGFTGPGLGPFFFFLLVGTVLTILVQSSSAAMAMTLTMASAGWLDYPTAAAIILGENIGTTITANLAALGANAEAKRAALAHTLFNVIGVIWMIFIFEPYLAFINWITPGDIQSTGDVSMLPAHLAMFHTLFNVFNTLLLVWFLPSLAWLVERVLPRKEGEDGQYRFQYLATAVQETPELYLGKARGEISKMAGQVGALYRRFLEALQSSAEDLPALVEQQKVQEDYVDAMHHELTTFLVDLPKDQLSPSNRQNSTVLLRIVSDLEAVADRSYSLMWLVNRAYKKKAVFPQVALEELAPYAQLGLQFLEFVQNHLNETLKESDWQVARELEQATDRGRALLKKNARKRLERGGADVRGELIYIDLVSEIEALADQLLAISESLRQFSA